MRPRSRGFARGGSPKRREFRHWHAPARCGCAPPPLLSPSPCTGNPLELPLVDDSCESEQAKEEKKNNALDRLTPLLAALEETKINNQSSKHEKEKEIDIDNSMDRSITSKNNTND